MPNSEIQDQLIRYLTDSAFTTAKVTEDCLPDIESAVQLITTCFKSGNKLLICGNGGSAAQSQHMAAELVPLGYPAIALTTDTSFLTAWSNDYEFKTVFNGQLLSLGVEGDVLLAISTSGQSHNVIEAMGIAKLSCGLKVILLSGSRLSRTPLSDITIRVPSTHTQHIQEAHLAICHIICELVVKEMQS